MNLDVASYLRDPATKDFDRDAKVLPITDTTPDPNQVISSFSNWENFPISIISHHGLTCCDTALGWLCAMDSSLLHGESVYNGPRWILSRYSWGPTNWPIFWCEAINLKTLDCGAQSAIAYELFKKRGLTAFRVQLVQEFSATTTAQWRAKWSRDGASEMWLQDDLIYHECCAIDLGNNKIKVWDGSAGSWVNALQHAGYSSVRAIRVHADDVGERNAFATWGNHRIELNRWQDLK